MLRTESLEEITDGKKYGINDMVKAGTGGCNGCSKCCETMADTIVLGPYDVMNLEIGTGKSFEELMVDTIELKLHDGIILPNMKSHDGTCVMLESGRCSIHANRPDFCRLFPLGRLYEDDSFSYVMQINQCDKASVKVKVKKWIDTEDYEKYSEYVLRWHGLIRTAANKCAGFANDADKVRNIMTSLLALFYQQKFECVDFHSEFEKRVVMFSQVLQGEN